MIEIVQQSLLAAAVVATVLPVLSIVASRTGWVDRPSWRKAHVGEIPITGGTAIGLGLLASAAYSLAWPGAAAGLAVGMLLLFLVGLVDDRFPIRARYRFAAQLAAAAAAIGFGDTLVRHLGECVGPMTLHLSILAVPFTLVAMTGLVNAYNMSDGADGLCGGLAAVGVAGFLTAAFIVEQANPDVRAFSELAPVGLPALAALVAFLAFNMRHPWLQRAKTFLGDGGSMPLGFLVAWLAIRVSNGYGEAGLPPAVALWVVAVPLADMVACMVRRVASGYTPMTPDHMHLHNAFSALGLSVRRSVAIILTVQLALAAFGLAAWAAGAPDYLLFWGFVAGCAFYVVRMMRFWARLSTPR